MLPGIDGSEIIVIALVALLVVGPKDLPKLLRQLGRFVGKMRSMADDFRSSFEDMARQSELDDLRKEVEALRTTRTLPGIEDVKSEIDAVGRDINDSLHASPVTYGDPDLMPETPVEPATHPLMDGLPPSPEAPPPEAPPIVVKKPRARKTVAPAAANPAAAKPVAKTASEPAPRRRAKSTAQ